MSQAPPWRRRQPFFVALFPGQTLEACGFVGRAFNLALHLIRIDATIYGRFNVAKNIGLVTLSRRGARHADAQPPLTRPGCSIAHRQTAGGDRDAGGS